MSKNEDETRRKLLSLKLLILEKDKAVQNREKARIADIYIFAPQNELEVAAIALAQAGDIGWKGSLYSLDYCDSYQDHTCYIFATRPAEAREQEWLLVSVDRRNEAKYWVTLGQKLLPEVYYAWAKVVGIPHPQFDPSLNELMNY